MLNSTDVYFAVSCRPMDITMCSPWQLVFLLILLVNNSLAIDAPAQILNYEPYLHLRTCAQPCLGGYATTAQIISVIGCGAPYYDSCYCRGMQDLDTQVTSFLSSCVNSQCSSNPMDLSSVFAAYDGYCSGKGITHPASNEATMIATNTETTGGGNTTPTVVVISTLIATDATGNSASTFTTRKSILLFRLAALCSICANVLASFLFG
jgi:hypothetical protein